MVISGRAKAVIGALVCFFLLGVVLVTGSTKGWFNPNDFNGERAAARIQVNYIYIPSHRHKQHNTSEQGLNPWLVVGGE